MKYLQVLNLAGIMLCLCNCLSAQSPILQKDFGEVHNSNTKGGQERFYTICQLPDGRMLAGGYKVPACRVITEKVPDSYWEKVVKDCPPDVNQQYLVYLDTGANLVKEKIWQADNLHGVIKTIKLLKTGYITVAERSNFSTEGIIISLFDLKDSLVSEKIILFEKPDFGKTIQQVSITAQNQVVIQVADNSAGSASKQKEWTFDTKLNLIAVRAMPESRDQVVNSVQNKLRGLSSTQSRIGGEIQLADKSKMSFGEAGTVTHHMIEIKHTKLQNQPIVLLTEPNVIGEALITDKWGNVWFVGTKINDSFDNNGWVARFKRK
jgi:hypothetical protein